MAQTNKLPKIQTSQIKGKREYFDLSHDVYATHRVGKITPYMCKFFDANGKMKPTVQTLEYNAPMVAPTVGDVKFKQWWYFVGLDKLCPNFAEFFASNPNLDANGDFMVQGDVPKISLRYLSMMALIGSFCTVYVTYKTNPYVSTDVGYGVSTQTDDIAFLYKASDMPLINHLHAAFSTGTGRGYYNDLRDAVDEHASVMQYQNLFVRVKNQPFTEVEGMCINANWLDMSKTMGQLGSLQDTVPLIPLSNYNEGSLYDWINTDGKPIYNDPSMLRYTHGFDCSPVPYDRADARISRTFEWDSVVGDNNAHVTNTYTLHFCFRLSDYGRAIRDLIIACGDELNFSSNKQVSFLPFIATYLAYYQCQSLQLFRNYKMTNAYKLTFEYQINNHFNYDIDWANQDRNSAFYKFLRDEIGTMWAICPQDFVTSHTRDPQISPLIYRDLSQFAESTAFEGDGVGINQQSSRSENGSIENTTPFIEQIKHDVVTQELLKRLSLQMNVNTLEGRKTKRLLEVNGFGEWLDLQQAKFISYGEMKLVMRPVVSQSDTSTSDGKGADLGQYGGRGYGAGSHRCDTYVNPVPGYLICLTTIYVDSGYTQAIDPYNYQTNFNDFYRRPYDALGFEINPKSLIHGSAPYVCEGEYGALDQPFGYVPRDMKYKQMSNRLLGSFTTGQMSDVYNPYHIERLLPIGHQNVVSSEVSSSWTRYELGVRFNLDDTPQCGLVWRYIGRYPWLGQYERIFKLQPAEMQRLQGLYNMSSYGENLPEVLAKIYTFFALSPENYTVLSTIFLDTWQDKVPISRSFGTLSEVFSGDHNTAASKE